MACLEAEIAEAREGRVAFGTASTGRTEDGQPKFSLHALLVQDIAPPHERSENVAVQPSTTKLRAFCSSLGVSPVAMDGWAMLHCSPVSAMLYYFVPQLCILSIVLILLTGIDIQRWLVSIPLMIAAPLNASHIVTPWMLGPMVCKSQLQKVSVYLFVLCMAVSAVGAFLEPPADKVPFDSSLISTVLIICVCFCMNLVLKTGLVDSELPSEPRTSMAKTLARAAIHTLRVMDALTDLSFIQVLLQQRSEGCWWFSEYGKCTPNTHQIVFLVLCALADLVVSCYMIVLGSEGLSDRTQRLILRLHVSALAFELGVIGVTLLNLASAARQPDDGHGSATASDHSSQMYIVIVSLGTTLITFCFTMIGAGSALAGFKKVTARISDIHRTRISFTSKSMMGEVQTMPELHDHQVHRN